MNFEDLAKDPFFIKFIQKTARMLGEWYQSKANDMTNDELYADSEFFPMYNPDKDYSEKSNGYVCRQEDGTMMRLVRSSNVATMSVNSITGKNQNGSIEWKKCWSKDPSKAKEFESSQLSPYMKDECCIYNGTIYRSLVDQNTESPSDNLNSWEKIEI